MPSWTPFDTQERYWQHRQIGSNLGMVFFLGERGCGWHGVIIFWIVQQFWHFLQVLFSSFMRSSPTREKWTFVVSTMPGGHFRQAWPSRRRIWSWNCWRNCLDCWAVVDHLLWFEVMWRITCTICRKTSQKVTAHFYWWSSSDSTDQRYYMKGPICTCDPSSSKRFIISQYLKNRDAPLWWWALLHLSISSSEYSWSNVYVACLVSTGRGAEPGASSTVLWTVWRITLGSWVLFCWEYDFCFLCSIFLEGPAIRAEPWMKGKYVLAEAY